MKSNVLIVEDSAEVRSGLQIALEGRGYRVKAASDGREGIRLFREWKPDIALLDIRMPRLSGIDVCTLIRNESDVPVIMFSGVDEREDVVLAMQRGADDYVLKDTGFKELLARVEKHLRERAAEVLLKSGPPTGKILPFARAGIEGREMATPSAVDVSSLKIQTIKVSAEDEDAGRDGGLLENLVIVAHSEPESLEELARVSARTGFEVVQASTGREAIETLSVRPPKLVVLGNVLTDMNCMAVVQAIVNHRLGELMGVVLALGRRSPELVRRARYMGVHEAVYHPWNDGRLDVAIRSALAATRTARSRVSAA